MNRSYQCFFSNFGLRENPFHVSPDPRFYHSTPAHDSALNELQYGLQTRQGFLVLTGEAGIGKTTLLNCILESLARRHVSTAYIFHPLLEPTELFEFILRDFGVNCESLRKGDLLRTFHEWLIDRNAAGDSPVVIIDEAQALSLQALDELRLLLNLETSRGKLLQIILVGQSELEEKLRRPELRQLRQRVMIHCRLPLFSEEQTAGYILARLSRAGLPSMNLFPQETLQVVHKHARGIPRLINLLCEHALITAYGEQQKTIAPEMIQRIAIDFDLSEKPISVENDYAGGSFSRLVSFPVPVVGAQPIPLSATAGAISKPETVRVQEAVAENVFAASSEVAEESPTTAQTLAPQTQRHVYWKRRSSGFQGGKVVRRFVAYLVDYWRQVVDSFMRDLRYFVRPLTLSIAESTAEQELSLRAQTKPPLLRSIIVPITNWLRHPMTSGHGPVQNEPNHTASSK
jgi:general secretion pathway protein A